MFIEDRSGRDAAIGYRSLRGSLRGSLPSSLRGRARHTIGTPFRESGTGTGSGTRTGTRPGESLPGRSPRGSARTLRDLLEKVPATGTVRAGADALVRDRHQ